MEEDVQLRTYTVADLKNWLIHNHPKEGLSSQVIAPARAFSIVHNPYVQDEMKVVCAVFVNEQIAAFTAAFPEILHKPKGCLAWWFTTLWCNPLFEGRGYGLVVVGTLAEENGIENCFDSEGAPETVEIMNMLGMKTVYRRRFVFSGKKIRTDSLKGILAWCLNQGIKALHYPRFRNCKIALEQKDFSLVYQQYLDDRAYSFICEHSKKDVFLRQQETFDWILRYPFYQSSLLVDRTLPENQFSSLIMAYQSHVIMVYSGDKLIGVSLLVLGHQSICVKYLYYEIAFASVVYSAVLLHGIKNKVVRFETGDNGLAEFVNSFRIFPRCISLVYSFSTPPKFDLEEDKTIQPGDGDMFV